MIGSLSPRLEFAPKSVKESCAETLLEAVISVMSIVIVASNPAFAPALLGSPAVGAGVIGGALDAGMQELAKGVGLIKHFSWGDVLGAGIGAGMMHMAKVTSAMNDLYPKAGTAVDFEKQMEAIRQLAIYYGLSNVSEQLVLIAMNKQKGFDIRQVFASMAETAMDNWVGVAMHAPVPALSDPTITAEQLAQRVSLDLLESAVGGAIMGSFDLEMFMAGEMGSYMGGRVANPIADYLSARQKVPVKSSQQIRQDSLAPHDASYLMASAAGQGKGMSPDFLGPYPGSDDPDDLLNYLLSIHSTDNHPAVQTKTRSQLQVQAQRQASKASQSSQGFWSSSMRRAESVWYSAVNDAESAWSGVTRRADAFVDAHPRVASVVRTMDDMQRFLELEVAVSSSVMNPTPVIDLSQRYPRVMKTAEYGAIGLSMLGGVGEVAGAAAAIGREFSLFEEGAALRLSGNRSTMFGARGAGNTRLLSSINRVSSNVANEPFISEEATAAGWRPPYPANIDVRQISLSKETRFVRLFTGDDPAGRFLVRYKEIAHIIDNPEALRIHLGLRETPTSIADVYVGPKAEMLVGPIGAQPKFGLTSNSGFQYQLLDEIPEESFRNPRPIISPSNRYNESYRP